MNCKNLEAVLFDYLDGTLAETARLNLERHLAGCSGCRERVEGLRSVSQALDRWQAPDVSPWFDQRLQARIRAEESAYAPWHERLAAFRSWFRPGYATALAALVIMSSLALWVSRPDPTGSAQAIQISAADAQKMEEVTKVVEDFELLSSFEPLGELKSNQANDL